MPGKWHCGSISHRGNRIKEFLSRQLLRVAAGVADLLDHVRCVLASKLDGPGLKDIPEYCLSAERCVEAL